MCVCVCVCVCGISYLVYIVQGGRVVRLRLDESSGILCCGKRACPGSLHWPPTPPCPIFSHLQRPGVGVGGLVNLDVSALR